MPDLLTPEQTVETGHLRHLLARDQMKEFSKNPLVMAKADGVRYWDVNGKEYLDGLAGIYVASVGHNNRRVIDAVKEQYDRLTFSPPMHGTNHVAVQCANLLADISPGDLNTVKFQCGGSEVTEAAIKMARQYHQLTGNPRKYKIISRYMSWHGSTMGSLSASGLKSRKSVNEPLAPGFIHVFPPTCYRCPLGLEPDTCGTACATMVDKVIDWEDADTVAAVMVEPIGHTGGIIDPPDDYLPKLREICDRHNVLLIFDEIITGFGRTGQMFAAETFGVQPDMICTGKGMSGGYAPVSALICRKHIADAFWGDAPQNPGFVEGHTNEGNPISCAAAIAVLSEILERDLCANARAMGDRLKAGLQRLAEQTGVIGDIRGKGLFYGIEFVKNLETKEQFNPPIGLLIGRRCIEHGLILRFDPHWIAMGPSLVITEQEIDELLAILERSLREVLAETS